MALLYSWMRARTRNALLLQRKPTKEQTYQETRVPAGVPAGTEALVLIGRASLAR